MRMKNPPHPGGIIIDVLEDLNMSATAVARALGISRYRLNRVKRGEIPISPELALRFETVIGSSVGCWLRMQAAYDEDRIRREGAAIVRGLKRLEPPPDPYEDEVIEALSKRKVKKSASRTPVKRAAKKRNGRMAGKPRAKAAGKPPAKMRKAA